MKCDKFTALIRDYMEEELSVEIRVEFESHRQACSPCGELYSRCIETTCKEVIGFLCDFVEGQLPTEQQEIFDRHLGLCPECRDYLDGYVKTIDICGKTGQDSVECDAIPDELVQAILAARRQGLDKPGSEPPRA